MKALLLKNYGSKESLKIEDVPLPIPKENQVLVRIKSTAINDYDWSMMRGKPFIYRLMFGLFKPKYPIMGMELSGIVEEVGIKVVKFKKGDKVFGDTSEFSFGTFAEYICADEKALSLMSKSMTFEEATSMPHASLLAYQSIFDVCTLEKNQKILINGAGGGVGTFALQMAKWKNAHVTGVDTGSKLDQMFALGFDKVIDYKKVDFTKATEAYDLILDTKTNRSPFDYCKALNKEGKYVTVGGNLTSLLQLLIYRKWILFSKKRNLSILSLKTNKHLDAVKELFEQGILKCAIEGPYVMEDIPDCIMRFGKGQHFGKIVINISN